MSKYAKNIESAVVAFIKLAALLSMVTAFLTGCWRL